VFEYFEFFASANRGAVLLAPDWHQLLMELRYELVPNLPRLAWAAQLSSPSDAVRILHGPWVETRRDCFFEGAWDGPFEDYRFHQAFTFLGSGGRIAWNGIEFAGPSHTCERLYSIRAGDQLFVSNSLAFVLALSGQRLDPKYPHYYLDLLDHYRAGIRIKDKRLRLAGCNSVELHDCCNLTVRLDLTMCRIEKPIAAPPSGFEDYQSFLSRTAEQVFLNASDAARRWAYRPVTTLSQGYDTTAVSAIAAKAGCQEAVTFLKSNGTAGCVDDSGREIARCLGLHVTEYERTYYDRLPERREHEFYIEPGGIDRSLVVMQDQLVGSLLLSGRFGERMWAREFTWGLPGDTGRPLLQLPTGFKLGGCALGEFRMKTGFIHFPLLYSGALHAPVIQAITASSAMKPWSVGGGYDRPIARRIAEEAGIPRHLFGQTKKGGPRGSGPERRSRLRQAVYSMWVASYWPPLRLLLLRLTGNRLNPAWRRRSFEVQRGVERMIEEYLAAISANEPSPASHSAQ
jgi:hypothetical protein